MPTSRFERVLPVCGVLAGLLFAAMTLLTWGAPSVGDGSAEYVRWVTDHQGLASAAGFLDGYFCVVMLMFAAGLRQALRSGEPRESTYSSVAYAGAITVALAVAMQAWLALASIEAAGDGRAAVVTTLGYVDDFGWIPWVAGSAVLFLGTGLGGLRTATLPKALAVATIVLGVLCLLGPTGVAVFLLTPFWLVVTGVVLYRRVSAASVPAGTSGQAVPGARAPLSGSAGRP